MYLAPVKIWWYLALWFVSYACLKLGYSIDYSLPCLDQFL
jgi:hypothetical protein